MKKLFSLILAVGLLFGIANQVMAFPTYSLTQVVYNETDNEVLVNLGYVPEIDFTATNVTLAQAGTVNLGQFTTIDSWENLNLAFFAARTTPSPRQSWIALTKDTITAIGNTSLLTFGNGANALMTSTGTGPVYVGIANQQGKVTYDQTMNSNSTAPGYFTGLNSADRIYGEANLGKLYTDGYVDMYLYHYSTTTLDRGADQNTMYTAVLRFNIDGSTVLNPVAAAVPIPGSLLLLGSGILGLLGIGRKRT